VEDCGGGVVAQADSGDKMLNHCSWGLKHTMAELEKKLNKLEIHCRHLLPRLHARTFGRVTAYCRCFTSRRTSDGVSDGVKGFGDRVDEHDEELIGDEVRKRGRGVWSFFRGKHGWRVKSSYSMRYSNSP
jgi:hypothetical protein